MYIYTVLYTHTYKHAHTHTHICTKVFTMAHLSCMFVVGLFLSVSESEYAQL